MVVGATCKENISYPDAPKFEVLDMGEGARIYDPIRVTFDEVTHRQNDGIMAMNGKIEDVIVDNVTKMMNKYWKKRTDVVVLPNQEDASKSSCFKGKKMESFTPAPEGSAIFMNPNDKSSKNKKGFAEMIESEVKK